MLNISVRNCCFFFFFFPFSAFVGSNVAEASQRGLLFESGLYYENIPWKLGAAADLTAAFKEIAPIATFSPADHRADVFQGCQGSAEVKPRAWRLHPGDPRAPGTCFSPLQAEAVPEKEI